MPPPIAEASLELGEAGSSIFWQAPTLRCVLSVTRVLVICYILAVPGPDGGPHAAPPIHAASRRRGSRLAAGSPQPTTREGAAAGRAVVQQSGDRSKHTGGAQWLA